MANICHSLFIVLEPWNECHTIIKRPLHNTVLAALLSTFKLGHLHEQTPCALSLNALRLPHFAKPHQRTSFTCPLGDRATVSLSQDLEIKKILLHL